MSLILEVTTAPCLLPGLPHLFMIPAGPLKAFEFEILAYFMGYSSSLYHSDITSPQYPLSSLYATHL